ncbi:hypothetical protein M0812_16559 [Anaeramoeba flamelloides]|uniref:RRM Nup35-type domain-containing protein n=1 Tax=Anaeramoeba flamelloides TaxID=1746091 RepID=A0AAV7Z6P5_9EUKA|nr:hypothetical protein M0812_16559 [Anaeramoeba flamelloides]
MFKNRNDSSSRKSSSRRINSTKRFETNDQYSISPVTNSPKSKPLPIFMISSSRRNEMRSPSRRRSSNKKQNFGKQRNIRGNKEKYYGEELTSFGQRHHDSNKKDFFEFSNLSPYELNEFSSPKRPSNKLKQSQFGSKKKQQKEQGLFYLEDEEPLYDYGESDDSDYEKFSQKNKKRNDKQKKKFNNNLQDPNLTTEDSNEEEEEEEEIDFSHWVTLVGIYNTRQQKDVFNDLERNGFNILSFQSYENENFIHVELQQQKEAQELLKRAWFPLYDDILIAVIPFIGKRSDFYRKRLMKSQSQNPNSTKKIGKRNGENSKSDFLKNIQNEEESEESEEDNYDYYDDDEDEDQKLDQQIPIETNSKKSYFSDEKTQGISPQKNESVLSKITNFFWGD